MKNIKKIPFSFVFIMTLLAFDYCQSQIASPEVTRKSVVHLTTDDGTCNGVLLNNSNNDGIRYILSAGHCISESNRFLEVVVGRDVVINGSNLRSTSWQSSALESLQLSRDLDYVLLRLNEPIPEHLTPYFAGWNANASVPVSSYGIHSPGIEKIFIEDLDRPQLATFDGINEFGGTPVANGTLNILRWDQGFTEAGSSGSPLFNNDSRLVGLLSGGASTATNPSNDFYTRFDLIFEEIKSWISPGQTDLFIDGLDFQLVTNSTFKKHNYQLSDPISGSTDNGTVSENFSGNNPASIKGIYLTVNAVDPTDLVSISVLEGGNVVYEQTIFSGTLNEFSENYIPLSETVDVTGNYSIAVSHNQSLNFPLTTSLNSTVVIGNATMENSSLLMSTLNEGVADQISEETTTINPVYPNPSTQNFYLEGGDIDKVSNIRIFTSKGDEIAVTTFKDYQNRLLIDMSGNQKGLYYMQYQLDNRVILAKLVLL
ncbi:MAG: trypsin-like serine protease [Bacteroidota bacterium]